MDASRVVSGDAAMQTMTVKKCWTGLLLAALVAGGLTPALAGPALSQSRHPSSDRFTSSHWFYASGWAQFFQNGRKISTPFVGLMKVDPTYVDRSFGSVGRIVDMAVRFPAFPEVPTFNRILTQGPEISGLTPLKYDVTLLNARGERAGFQFTTAQSTETFPGFGTPMGSLTHFQGGAFMQGSNTGALAIENSQHRIFMQNFDGQIVRVPYDW
jgi:hypothetical protein